MKKYRIRIKELPSGDKKYFPQVKVYFLFMPAWQDVDSAGALTLSPSGVWYEADAIKAIENYKKIISSRDNSKVTYKYL